MKKLVLTLSLGLFLMVLATQGAIAENGNERPELYIEKDAFPVFETNTNNANGYIISENMTEEKYEEYTFSSITSDMNSKIYDYMADMVILIGDSRTSGIKQHVGNATYISKIGAGFNWFSSDAVRQLDKLLSSNCNKDVIIGFGINDLVSYYQGGNDNYALKYAEEINNLIDIYPDTRFYFLSVNPIDKNYYTSSGSCINKDEFNTIIEDFNQTVRLNCNAKYIDSYNYLMKKGFKSFDGIHYNGATNTDIYEFIGEHVLFGY